MIIAQQAQQVLLLFIVSQSIKLLQPKKRQRVESDLMPDNEMVSKKQAMAAQFIAALPHCVALGMKMKELGDGTAAIEMPYSEQIIGDPKTKVVHGGAVSALMDTTCGAAVMSHKDNLGGTATIDLRIEYLRSARPGQTIVARATCYHVTRSVAFVRAEAMDDDTGHPVATATGTFTMERKA